MGQIRTEEPSHVIDDTYDTAMIAGGVEFAHQFGAYEYLTTGTQPTLGSEQRLAE